MILEGEYLRKQAEAALREQIKSYRVEIGRVVFLDADGKDLIWLNEPNATPGDTVNLEALKMSISCDAA